jgi:hypothetical protein
VDVVARDGFDVELRAAVGLYVRGHVIPPAGKPLLEGAVVVEDRARGLSMRAPWNAEGSFRVGPLTNGPQTVIAESSCGHAPSEPLVVDAGTDDVKLDLRAGATIAGRVLGVHGGEVDCSICLTRHGVSPEIASTTKRSYAGDFSFTGLDAGSYDIAASSRYGGMGLGVLSGLQVAQGAAVSDLVVRLEPAGEIRCRILDPRLKGELQVEANGLRLATQVLNSQDSFWLPASPGRVTARLWNNEKHEQIEHTVDVESERIIDITFGKDGR